MSGLRALATRAAREFVALDAPARVRWAVENLPGPHVLSSSFGAQAAVMLHLVARVAPDLSVILVDTGYLFPETYAFADTLTKRLHLNLRVVRPGLSAAWLEARYGKLWEQGPQGLARYNHLTKVLPMQRALADLGAASWFSGLRRDQSESRATTPFVVWQRGRFHIHPIADWSDRDVDAYLRRHDLPYHPLWADGYVSIGDTHTTTRWQPGMRSEDTRFFGWKRECGLHLEV